MCIRDRDGGIYRIRRRNDEALFGHNAGPHSWKNALFPPSLRLWHARRSADGGLEVEEEAAEPPRYAFIGVRSCDLHAIAIQDKVFVDEPHVDLDYQARRDGTFIV